MKNISMFKAIEEVSERCSQIIEDTLEPTKCKTLHQSIIYKNLLNNVIFLSQAYLTHHKESYLIDEIHDAAKSVYMYHYKTANIPNYILATYDDMYDMFHGYDMAWHEYKRNKSPNKKIKYNRKYY